MTNNPIQSLVTIRSSGNKNHMEKRAEFTRKILAPDETISSTGLSPFETWTGPRCQSKACLANRMEKLTFSFTSPCLHRGK